RLLDDDGRFEEAENVACRHTIHPARRVKKPDQATFQPLNMNGLLLRSAILAFVHKQQEMTGRATRIASRRYDLEPAFFEVYAEPLRILLSREEGGPVNFLDTNGRIAKQDAIGVLSAIKLDGTSFSIGSALLSDEAGWEEVV
ncbi:MAG: hypothetical protein AAFV01_06030, partial [Bacteroidota bacterium]